MERTSLKVIAVYAGPRREWSDRDSIEESRKIINCWLNLLKTVNYGEGMDVVFVNSEPDSYQDNEKYKSFVSMLNNLKGKKIKTGGKIMIEHRPNMGFMLGAYNYAFNKYKEDYNYFWFSEDDRFNIIEGSLVNGIEKIESSKDTKKPVGFICTQAYIRRGKFRSTGCRGSAGISSSEILKKMYDETTGLPHFSMRKYKAREDHSNMGLAEKMEYKLVDYIKKNEYKIGHLDNQYGISIIWGRPGGGPHWNQYRKGWSARIVDYCQACSGD